ncbi:PAS domain S-box protein [Paenibacillus camerounensis]|uniref:PAS domain S-box protein n=1 Tax=Paenibacillus camerounensis TaxID=1243663 RepID=UPI0006948EB2|nr:PAS domain S-box protein [Paenibacillus camerounensis]
MENGRIGGVWAALVLYILACIWVEIQYSSILWMIIVTGGPLLVCCAFWKRGGASGPELKKSRQWIQLAFLLWSTGNLFLSLFPGGQTLSFGEEPHSVLLAVMVHIPARVAILFGIIHVYRRLKKRISRLQVLWDQITIVECIVGSIWFIFFQDEAFHWMPGGLQSFAVFFYLLVPLLVLAGLTLIWIYMDSSQRTPGCILLILGIALIGTLDLIQALHGGLISSPYIDSLYRLSIAGIAASGMMGTLQISKMEPAATPENSPRMLKGGILFLMYPVMIVLLKGFSVYVFLYFTIIIMAYFIVRLYAKQTIAAKKMLETEREYNEKLRLYLNVIEQAPMSILITDKDRQIEYINPYFTEVTGYSKAEILGKTPSLLKTDKTERETYNQLNETLDAGGRWHGEFVNRKKNGEEYTEAVIVSSIKNDSGEVTHYVGIKEDISEYKRMRKELSDQLFFTSQLIDTLPYPLFYIDERQCFLGCNAAYEQAFQVSRTDLAGIPMSMLPHLPEDGYRNLSEMMTEVAATGRSSNRQIIRTFASGEAHHILYSLSAFRLSDYSVGGYLGIMTDISDLKHKEKEIIDNRNFLDAIISHMPLMITVKDAQTLKIFKANQASADFLGIAPEQLVGLDLGTVFPEAIARKLMDADKRVIATGQTFSEIEIIPDDGEHCNLRYVLTTKLPIMDAEGQPLYLLSVSEDITDAKRQEAELKSALNLAEEATAAKSQFLANMSHEIRTPMNAIIGMAYLALKTGLNPVQQDYISKIHNAGTSLLSIINEILDFSKVESGKLELENTDFTLMEVFTGALDLSSQTAGEKGLQLLCTIQPEVPAKLSGDPLRLGQIITNLLSNAVKFTSEGEISIAAELNSRIDSRVKLQISVRDTGIGMSKETESKVFQAFTQADSSTTRRFGGTGLGLAISLKLVENMGGSLWVDSVEGQGSTFSFTAWFDLAQNTASPVLLPEAASQVQEKDYRLAGTRVLVAEDNEINRQIAAELLRSQGMLPDLAVNGAEAVRLIEAMPADRPYGIVLMDLQMPEMDGFEAAARIRELSPGLPVIAMTARTMQEERERSFASGMNGHIAKPVDPDILFTKISRWVTDGTARQAGASAEVSAGASAGASADASAGATTEVSPEVSASAGAGIDASADAGALSILRLGGIDTAGGLTRVGHNRTLYSSLLLKYADSQHEMVQALREALRKEEAAAAERLAHNLKGVSGNLGVTEIEKLAGSLGAMFISEAEPEELEELLRRLETAVQDSSGIILKQLGSSRHPAVPAEETGQLTVPAVQLLERLLELLLDDDSEAVDYYADIRDTVAHLIQQADMKRLEHSLSRFEYEEAVELTRQVLLKSQYEQRLM